MTGRKTLDRDAMARAARDPFSRRKFLVLTGGTGAATTFLAACGEDEEETTTDESGTGESGADPLAQFGEGDIGIMNYALTLEHLEAGFYAAVIDAGLFKGADLELIKVIGDHETQHVEALTQAVEQAGGKPAEAPQAEFPLDDAETVLNTAADVENLGAAAYLGQAAAIESEDVLASALAIHTVEARHAAVLNTLIGESPTPDGAFAEPADAQTVLDGVQPFLKS